MGSSPTPKNKNSNPLPDSGRPTTSLIHGDQSAKEIDGFANSTCPRYYAFH